MDGSFGVTSPLYLREITPSGQLAGRHPGTVERAEHQLLLQVGGCAQPVQRRQVRDVHRLRGGARTRLTSRTPTPPASSTRPTRSRRVLPGGRPAVGRTGSSRSPRPTPTAATTAGRRSRPRSTASTTSTRRVTRATAPTRSRRESSSAPARRSSPRRTCPCRSRTRVSPPPSAVSASPSWATRPDKVGKDDNFRGLTLYNNVLYYTKGSGGNGVDTVYFLDTTGKACLNGVGAAGARRAAADRRASRRPTTRQPAWPATCASSRASRPRSPRTRRTPATTRSGSGSRTRPRCTSPTRAPGTTRTRTAPTRRPPRPPPPACRSGSTTPRPASGQLAYTLQNGLNLGAPYTVRGYPTGLNTSPGGTGLPWAPATDGLRNLTGQVNPNGTVTIWAVTSTVSGGGDQGADPNKLVSITDKLGATALPGVGVVLDRRSGGRTTRWCAACRSRRARANRDAACPVSGGRPSS